MIVEQKTEKAWKHLIIWMTSGEHKVNVGGAKVPDYKYMHNKSKSEFPTGQVEYSWSCECQGVLPSDGALNEMSVQ